MNNPQGRILDHCPCVAAGIISGYNNKVDPSLQLFLQATVHWTLEYTPLTLKNPSHYTVSKFRFWERSIVKNIGFAILPFKTLNLS